MQTKTAVEVFSLFYRIIYRLFIQRLLANQTLEGETMI